MIFSKDKKPTEPGWYWHQYCDDSPEPIRVYGTGRYGPGVGLVYDFNGSVYDVNIPHETRKFGDRIETPSVEADKGGEP